MKGQRANQSESRVRSLKTEYTMLEKTYTHLYCKGVKGVRGGCSEGDLG